MVFFALRLRVFVTTIVKGGGEWMQGWNEAMRVDRYLSCVTPCKMLCLFERNESNRLESNPIESNPIQSNRIEYVYMLLDAGYLSFVHDWPRLTCIYPCRLFNHSSRPPIVIGHQYSSTQTVFYVRLRASSPKPLGGAGLFIYLWKRSTLGG